MIPTKELVIAVLNEMRMEDLLATVKANEAELVIENGRITDYNKN